MRAYRQAKVRDASSLRSMYFAGADGPQNEAADEPFSFLHAGILRQGRVPTSPAYQGRPPHRLQPRGGPPTGAAGRPTRPRRRPSFRFGCTTTGWVIASWSASPGAAARGLTDVLIDCGVNALVKSAKSIMEKVVRDIAETTKGHLDLVILTHEHWDHVSGFSTQQAQSLFGGMDSIDEVWYAWTEDPSPANVLGHRLRAEREAKVRATRRAAAALPLLGDFAATERARRIGSLLGSFGYDSAEATAPMPATNEQPIGKTRAAFEYLMKRRGTKVRYRRPTDAPTVLAGTDGVRAYVLGPPENEGLLKRSAPTKKGREVYEFGADLMIDEQLESALMRLAGLHTPRRRRLPIRLVLPAGGHDRWYWLEAARRAEEDHVGR